MKKKIVSIIAAASVLLGTVSGIGATETAVLSPRSALGIDSGYIKGITGLPTVNELAAEFDGDVTVVSPKGETLSGEMSVPAESVVKSGSVELGKAVVPGDVNMDGRINISDASAMLQTIAKWDVAVSTASSDVDISGGVNLSDVTAILKYIAKWDITLGGEYFIDVRDGYKLLANDSKFDAELVSRVKEFAGIDLEVITEAKAGDKFITFGRNLHEKYDFIDGDAVAALQNNTGVADDGLYIDTYGGNVYLTVNDEGNPNTAMQFLHMNFDLSGVVDIYRGYCGTLSGMTESGVKYQRAVRNILESEPVTDGTNGMNGDILAAITNAEYTAPKNIIYMIGDGMGKNIVTAAEYCHKDELYGGTMTINYLPNEGRQSTYSSDQQITDSAAGGTALATGYKTTNGTISQAPAVENEASTAHKTLLELASEKGKSTGVIVTKSVTDATPATFTAHVDGRSEETEIARQQLLKLADGTLDVILGGGYDFYNDAKNAEAMSAAVAAGLTYTDSWDIAASAQMPLAGIFTAREMSTVPDSGEPHIAAMTDLALDLLSDDEDGFFLMVEGSKIDTFGHNNDFGTQVDEAYEFDCAVAVALRYVALNPDTVLIITADHETGELAISPEPTTENIRTSYRYSSGGHHWVDVPVYAVGYRTEELVRLQENTDIAIFVAELMGEENFGSDSSDVYTLFDMTDKATTDAILALNENNEGITVTDNGIRVQYSNSLKNVYLPLDKVASEPDKTQNVSAIRITFTNMASTPKTLPLLAIKSDIGSSTVGERITYVQPGETFEYTYVLESQIKNDGLFNSTYEMILSLRGSSADFAISGISVVNRPFGE